MYCCKNKCQIALKIQAERMAISVWQSKIYLIIIIQGYRHPKSELWVALKECTTVHDCMLSNRETDRSSIKHDTHGSLSRISMFIIHSSFLAHTIFSSVNCLEGSWYRYDTTHCQVDHTSHSRSSYHLTQLPTNIMTAHQDNLMPLHGI